MRSAASSRGFTLVEVLVATVLVAVGLLGALTAFSIASRVTGAASNDTVVSLLAQEKLAELRLMGPAELAEGSWTGDFGPDYPAYSWQVDVQQPDEYNVVPVRLTIHAPEAGRTRELRFATLVF